MFSVGVLKYAIACFPFYRLRENNIIMKTAPYPSVLGNFEEDQFQLVQGHLIMLKVKLGHRGHVKWNVDFVTQNK